MRVVLRNSNVAGDNITRLLLNFSYLEVRPDRKIQNVGESYHSVSSLSQFAARRVPVGPWNGHAKLRMELWLT